MCPNCDLRLKEVIVSKTITLVETNVEVENALMTMTVCPKCKEIKAMKLNMEKLENGEHEIQTEKGPVRTIIKPV